MNKFIFARFYCLGATFGELDWEQMRPKHGATNGVPHSSDLTLLHVESHLGDASWCDIQSLLGLIGQITTPSHASL
jgi:hypothetical protein